MPEIVGTSTVLAVVVISILLSGIAIGLGRSFGYKRIERFGIEELAQAIINAALVGGAMGMIAVLSTTSASFASVQCADGSPINELSCNLQSTRNVTFALYQETERAAELAGYYQTLEVRLDTVSIQPLSYLSSTLNILSRQAADLQLLLTLSYLQSNLVAFLQQNAVAYLLSAGLVLRSFFATRKAGAFLIALFLGLYIFYPLILLTIPSPAPTTASALQALKTLVENPAYSAIPIVDLNGDYAIAAKLDNMSLRATPGSDLTGDITVALQASSQGLSALWTYLVVGPLAALLVLAVLVRELTHAFSAEIGFGTASAI